MTDDKKHAALNAAHETFLALVDEGFETRAALSAACEAYKVHVLRSGHGTPTRAVVAPDGTRYESLGDAARAEGVTRSTIHQRARKGLFGWRFA